MGTKERGQNWYQSIHYDVLIAGKCSLPCPKGHHHERSINVLSGITTFLRHPDLLGQ